ncbi:MAG: non-canonical purine NTP pyrophosphatase [Edaphobacter sp.]|nr:non-canonical purine NTP pyrophosphatase [Edaphobacter sp.]MDE1175635.1 non-canonical purine NTP pyrophosphatase [Edaphobacter sp.]
MIIYVATTNQGKLRDFAAAAATRNREPIQLAPLPGLKEIPAPAEDESTFAGNARIKAIYYSKLSPGNIVIADDSGLQVDALNGAPGVRSARYAEDEGFPTGETLDERNNLCLLAALAEIPATQRAARYRCVLSAARDGAVVAEGDGAVEGEILDAPRGTLGFGYDPLFYLPSLGKTMAEIDAATRLSLSHRGEAFRHLLRNLEI